MLIRSQNKAVILNLYNIDCINANYNGEVSAFNGEERTIIGEYSSKEKAIKVLDMIQVAYEASCYCDHAFDDAAKVMRPYIFVNNTVFQMPQDSEVEA